MDKDRDGRYRSLIEKVREVTGNDSRIKGKGKGKEILLRFDGEVVEGEDEAVVVDPRKAPGFRKATNLRPARAEFYEVQYEVHPLSIHTSRRAEHLTHVVRR
jgi:histone-lysine N-methyltransferase SETD1